MNFPFEASFLNVPDALISSFFQQQNTSGNEPELAEGPGLVVLSGMADPGNAVRHALIPFQNHFQNLQIIDLGNMAAYNSQTLKELVLHIISLRCIPVLLGFEQQMMQEIAGECQWNIYQVSNMANKKETDALPVAVRHIAYQRHLSSLAEIYELEDNAYNSMSLGKMRTFPSLLEPVLRDVQLLQIHLNSLRKSDAPNIADALPTGLQAEELCQLAKYAGLGDRIRCLFISCDNIVRTGSPEASIIAEVIWYFAEGLNMNTYDSPEKAQDTSEFIVTTEAMEQDYEFVKHNQTQKWWFRCTSAGKPVYLACSQEEVQATVDGELPDRLARFLDAVSI